MADPAPIPTVSARPLRAIEASIARAAARLRALREKQARSHFTQRRALALEIRDAQEELDRLYEEKRIARALREHGAAAPAATRQAQDRRRTSLRDALASQVFAST
jgi:hypothetical protein